MSLRRLFLCAVLTLWPLSAGAQAGSPPPARKTAYGADEGAGHRFTHDGITLYYEVYGQGEPLLLIHGNGASIAAMSAQIAYFRSRYQVIAMDSRDHGRSADAPGPLTFEAMTDDLAALLDHLHARPAYVVGWSDGAIEALLLGVRHPARVRRIVAMAANLDPDPTAFDVAGPPPEPTPAQAQAVLDSPDPAVRRAFRVDELDRQEPHIPVSALEAIQAPTLVLASDHDVIRDAHTLRIYHHIPNAQLGIFPDATHMIPRDDPARFNAAVERFFTTAFVPRGRRQD
jgi:pimeloyl-ACP methyl ester carboxylesterase